MTQLLLSRNNALEDPSKEDVSLWYQIYKLINSNVTLIDRCNKIVMPYDFKNVCPMPTDLSSFNKSYKEVAVERAQQLIAHSKTINKPILILYSGGIDSTLVVISFLLATQDTSNIHIALNLSSIQENPRFYYNHIRGKFKLVPSEQMLDLLTGEYLFVGGEFNDQTFGSDIYKQVINYSNFSLLMEPYSEQNIVPFFEFVGMSPEGARYWYSLLDSQIKSTNLCEVKLVKDFFWWLNFCFKWQSVYYRIVSRSNNKDLLSEQFLDTYYQQFFNTDDFQRWSMLNPDKKIVDSWTSYKITAKQMIFEYTKDQDYFDNKTKLGSLAGIFRQRTVPDALDADLKPIYTINKADYYLENNSFNIK
jgi:hypothetical protein